VCVCVCVCRCVSLCLAVSRCVSLCLAVSACLSLDFTHTHSFLYSTHFWQSIKTIQDLHQRVTIPASCNTLPDFLATFGHVIPIVQGDADALERVAYEVVEDQAHEGVAYLETRYSPQLFADEKLNAEGVVAAINAGLDRASNQFNVKVRSILCCMRHEPSWSMDVVDLAHNFRNHGVVGIDLAGDESFPAAPHIEAFTKAKYVSPFACVSFLEFFVSLSVPLSLS
jgi:adenosine deaminase